MAGRFEALFMKLYDAIKSRYPSWGEPPKQPAEKIFERGHPRLLADLARYCARSYKWTSTTFATEMAEERVTSFAMFRRRSGGLSWRPGGLVWMPISYVALLFSFAFVVSLLLAAGPASWSDWHEGRNAMLQIPGLALEYIRQFVVWAGSWILAFLILLSSAIIAFFSMLGRWLPVCIVTAFTDSGMVLGIGVAWLLDNVASPVMFWVPPSAEEWLRGLREDWLRFLLYELRAIFGLALFIGSLLGVIIFFFPRLASGRAFGLIAPDGKSATIIFCGSTFVDNFTINACVWLYRKPIRHRGFHRAWSHIKPEIEQWLATAVPKDAEIFMAGHSLGGAIAEIAAFDLAPNYPIGLVAAFGSSRIGDPQMREIYRQRLDKNQASIHERTWHITHDDDTIPRLPPTRYFNHVGEGYLLYSGGALYSGTRTSIYYDYLRKIHEIRFLHIFFDENPYFTKGMGYPALDLYGKRLPISAWQEFKWKARLTAFFLRDTFPVYFAGIWFGGLLVYLYAMLVHYGRAIRKGLEHDHKVSLYRDALQERADGALADLINTYGAYARYKDRLASGLPGVIPPAAGRSPD